MRPTINKNARATLSKIRHVMCKNQNRPDLCMVVICKASAVLPSRKEACGGEEEMDSPDQELLGPREMDSPDLEFLGPTPRSNKGPLTFSTTTTKKRRRGGGKNRGLERCLSS